MKKPKTRPKASAIAHQPAWFTNTMLHYAMLFLLCFGLYANTLTHDFTQDDAIVIYDNEFTTQGIAGIPSILKYDTFRGFFKVEGKDKLVSGGRYRPLTLVMFAIGVDLFGVNPFVGHLMNIFWYALTCILLYIWLLRMLSHKRKSSSFAIWVALLTAMLFAAHPLHTEVVANIKGRDEIMALLGAILSAYLSLRAYQERKPLWTIISALVFFITLFSKENAITFLGVIPLMFFFFTKATVKEIALYTAPLIVSALVFMSIRASIIGGGLGEASIELMNNPFVKIENNQYVHFTASERIGTVFYTLLKYIQLQLFPHPLTHDYYPRHIGILSMTSPAALVSVFLHLGLLAYAAVRFLKKDILSFAILFYLGTLFIVSNLLFPIGTNMAERLIFMPSVGFCIVVAVVLYRLGKRMAQPKLTDFKQFKVSLLIAGAMIMAFSAKTVLRNPVWKDNFTLFTTDVKTSSNSAKLQNSVGGELLSQATKDTENPNLQMVQDAVPHLEKAIQIHPNYKNAYLLLGNAYHYLKQYDQAISSYNKAISLDGNYVDALQNLAVSYRENKAFDKSVQQLEMVRNIAPKKLNIDENIAYTYEEAGKYYGSQNQHQEALNAFEKASKYGADKGKYLYFMGLAYTNLNQVPQAIESMEKALQATDKNDNKKYILRSLADIYQNIDPAKAQNYLTQLQQIK